MDKKISQTLKYFFSIILAALLLWFAFRGVEWKEFLGALKATRWGFIMLSMLAALLALVFREERWRLQLAAINPGISRIRIWDGSNIGNFLSLVIPGTGEFYRCAFVGNKKSGYDRTFGTIVVERAWDILAILALLAAALLCSSKTLLPFVTEHVAGPLSSRFRLPLWAVCAICVAAISVMMLALVLFRGRSRFCRRCVDALKGIWEGAASFAGMKGKWLFLFYTVCIWGMYILMTWFTFLGVPGLEHLGPADALFISAVGNIASVIPTPGNLGAYHYLVGLAISSIYFSSTEILATALLCATLSHGSHALLLIVLALVSYTAISLRKGQSRRKGCN